MKHKRVTRTIVEDIYLCEKCESRITSAKTCPEHGEFCYNCSNKKESRFPLMICPECNITWKEVIEHCGIGPGGGLIKKDLPEPFIIVRDDSSGYWIGSKKSIKSRSTIAKPGRIIRVYEQ